MTYKALNKKQEATVAKLKDDLIVHAVQDDREAYLTIAHKIRVRIDNKGDILDAWVDK